MNNESSMEVEYTDKATIHITNIPNVFVVDSEDVINNGKLYHTILNIGKRMWSIEFN